MEPGTGPLGLRLVVAGCGDGHDVAVPVPDVWPEAGAEYVQLSPAYDDPAAEARRRGWPVTGGSEGAHLDVATAPARVADLLR